MRSSRVIMVSPVCYRFQRAMGERGRVVAGGGIRLRAHGELRPGSRPSVDDSFDRWLLLLTEHRNGDIAMARSVTAAVARDDCSRSSTPRRLAGGGDCREEIAPAVRRRWRWPRPVADEVGVRTDERGRWRGRGDRHGVPARRRRADRLSECPRRGRRRRRRMRRTRRSPLGRAGPDTRSDDARTRRGTRRRSHAGSPPGLAAPGPASCSSGCQAPGAR